MRESDLARLERLEAEYWRTSSAGSNDVHSLDSLTNTLNKIGEAGVFVFSLLPFLDVFKQARSVLEIGAGQGWAGCIVKRLCPQARVSVSDISPRALAGLPQWQHIFGVALDGRFASRSYQLPVRDGAVDCLFCFASAHHFHAHDRACAEIFRVLAPGGHAFYFHEPSCPAIWHPLAMWRVNRKRPEVAEDVLVPSRIEAAARSAGLGCEVVHTPTLFRRAPLETVYYGALNALPFLQRVLPCTVTFHFSKP